MMKWIVGVLLLANLLLLGWMRWGSALTVDTDAVQAALNPDKIRLADMQPHVASIPAAVPVLPKATKPQPPASAPTADTASPSAPAAAEPVAVSKEMNCAEWGEFSGGDLVRAQQTLAALKLGDRLTQRNVEHDRGYWVYIPPLRNRAEVEKKISQLKVRGVWDYFVVQEAGKWQNAISLGVFRTEEAAQKFLAALREKGVRTAKVGERTSRLKFVVFALKDLDAGMVARLGAIQKGFAGSELVVSTCGN